MSTSEFRSPASRRLKFQLIFTLGFVAFALLVTWLTLGESSPLYRYFVDNPGLRNLWTITAFVPFALAAVLSGNPHSPPMVIYLFFSIVQWVIVAFLLSMPLSSLWLKLQK